MSILGWLTDCKIGYSLSRFSVEKIFPLYSFWLVEAPIVAYPSIDF